MIIEMLRFDWVCEIALRKTYTVPIAADARQELATTRIFTP